MSTPKKLVAKRLAIHILSIEYRIAFLVAFLVLNEANLRLTINTKTLDTR